MRQTRTAKDARATTRGRVINGGRATSHTLTQRRSEAAGAPVPSSALQLLARSDAELVAAQLAGTAEDRFLHAHLAALRAGAALLEVTGRPVRRPVPRTVWDMVSAVAPDLAEWSAFFASGAPARSAIEAGRDGMVDEDRAERTVCAAEDFQDAVRAVLEPHLEARQRPLALRAS